MTRHYRYSKLLYTPAGLVLNALGENPRLTQSELSELLGLGHATIERAVKSLKNEGLLPLNNEDTTRANPSKMRENANAPYRVYNSVIDVPSIKFSKWRDTAAIADTEKEDVMGEKFPSEEETGKGGDYSERIIVKRKKERPVCNAMQRGKQAAYALSSHVVDREEQEARSRSAKGNRKKGLQTSQEYKDNIYASLDKGKLPSEIDNFRANYFFTYYIEQIAEAYKVEPIVIDSLGYMSGKLYTKRVEELTQYVNGRGGFDTVKELLDFYLDPKNWKQVVESGKLGNFKEPHPTFGTLLKGYHARMVAFMKESHNDDTSIKPMTDFLNEI